MKTLKKLKPEVGLWLADDEMPEPGYNDVRIKIHKTAICGTDIHIYQWDEWSQKTVPIGLTTGHEFVGVVDTVGEGVTQFKAGQRVSGEGHITCGHCRNCRAGMRHRRQGRLHQAGRRLRTVRRSREPCLPRPSPTRA